MSCKRKHRARGLGCRVGAVRLRGCSRECCPYPDAAIDANERIAYSTRDSRSLPRPLPTDTDTDNTDTDTATATDNTDDEADWIDGTLAPAGHHACRAPYRPKFVCVPCRRVFKVAVIPWKEYVVWGENGGEGGGGGGGGGAGGAGNWVDSPVTPVGWYSKAREVGWGRVQRDPARWEAVERGVRAYHLNLNPNPSSGSTSRTGSGDSGSGSGGGGGEEGEGEETNLASAKKDGVEGVDVGELRTCHPDAWWRPLNERWVRCPGCGKAGQAVGGKFEAPPRGRGGGGAGGKRKKSGKGKKSEKAWRRVEERLGAGERFTYCMSRAEEERFLASWAQARVAMEAI